jgi:hypothetical protein
MWSGHCTGSGAPSTEVCDGVDNDCNGVVDEGCAPCVPGQTRGCYDGPAHTVGVGACHAGSETCAMQANGSSAWSACTNEVTPTPETCNHVDDDCNGSVDDSSNNSSGACASNVCPSGETPTYVPADGGFGSGVSDSSTPLWQVVCSPSAAPCPAGQVRVEPSGVLGGLGFGLPGGNWMCVPPPPTCAAGQILDFQSGAWSCETCEVLVQFGSMYGNNRVCTTHPMLNCGRGQVPTFVYESRTWQCRPTCNNGTYDRHYLDGQLVCIPC